MCFVFHILTVFYFAFCALIFFLCWDLYRMNRCLPMNKMRQTNLLVCAVCLLCLLVLNVLKTTVLLTILLCVLAGFAHVSGRLKEIVGVLINCFQDFIPLIHTPGGFDEKSFSCLHHILCSIGYAIKFSIRMHVQRQNMWLPAYEDDTLMLLDQDIAPLISKKLLGSFPLNPENNLSGKVCITTLDNN